MAGPSRKRLRARRGFRGALAALLAAGALAVPAAFLLDARVARAFEEAPPWVMRVGTWTSIWGDWDRLLAPGLLLLAAAFVLRRTRMRRIAASMLLAACLAGACANVAKGIAGRSRPNAPEIAQGFHGMREGGEWTFFQYRFGSFFSGHAAVSAGFFGVLLFARRRLALLGLLVLPVIPAARLMTRSHYLSDVVVGCLAGLVAAALVWFVLSPRLRVAVRRRKREAAA